MTVQSTTVTISIRLSDLPRLDAAASAAGMTRSAFVQRALAPHLGPSPGSPTKPTPVPSGPLEHTWKAHATLGTRCQVCSLSKKDWDGNSPCLKED